MGSSPLDKKIKGTVVADMLHIVGIYPHDTALLRKYSKPASATVRSQSASQTSNPFTFSSLSKMMVAQEAYRRDPVYTSVDIQGLGEENEPAWLLLLMAENEIRRSESTRFHLVHPTPMAAGYYTTLYKCGRFSDHLLAKWVANGGSKGMYGKFIPQRFLTEEMLKQRSAKLRLKSPNPTGYLPSTYLPASGSSSPTTKTSLTPSSGASSPVPPGAYTSASSS